MAADEESTAQEPESCLACRGTGIVLATQGEDLKPQPCPWCDGDGVRKRDHDAQARWREPAQSA